MGFFTALMLLLIGLKLTGFIDWSWWIVLFPLVLDAIVFVIILAFGGFAALTAKREASKKPKPRKRIDF